jgi:hypothetical protein
MIIIILLSLLAYSLSQKCESNMNQKILKIHNSNLGVSEPEPSWFGNPPNEKNN